MEFSYLDYQKKKLEKEAERNREVSDFYDQEGGRPKLKSKFVIDSSRGPKEDIFKSKHGTGETYEPLKSDVAAGNYAKQMAAQDAVKKNSESSSAGMDESTANAIGAAAKGATGQLAAGGAGSTMGAVGSGMTGAGAALLVANPWLGGGLMAAGALSSIMGGKAARKQQEEEAKAQAINNQRTQTVNQLNNMIKMYQGGVI